MKKLIIRAVLVAAFAARAFAGTSYIWNGAVSNSWLTATNWTPAGTPGSTDTATITNGAPVVDAAVDVGTVNLGGGATLYATAGLTVVSQFDWTGGTVAGQLIIDTNALLELNAPGGSLSMAGAAIINYGTVQWEGGTLLANSNTVVTNNGTWLAQTAAQFSNPNGGSGAFYNNGSFVTAPTNSADTFAGIAFYNGGAVTAGGGTLSFSGGGAFGGTLLASNGATIELSGGGVLGGAFAAEAGASVVLNGGVFTNDKASFGGEGSSSMTGGSLLLTNDVSPGLVLAGGTVLLGPQFQASGAITNLSIAGATLTGTNTVSGKLAWRGGEIDGVLTVNSGGVLDLNGSANLVLKAALTNAGKVIWRGSSDWYLSNPSGTNGGWINNLATGVIDIWCDQTLHNQYGSEWLDNNGVLTKSQGSGATHIGVLFTNAGTVSVLNGALDFGQSGTFGGSFSAANGAAVNFSGGGVLSGAFSTGFDASVNLTGGSFTNTSEAAFSGQGVSQQSGGTMTLLNNAPANLAENGGTVILGPSFQNGSINNLALNDQTLEGSNIVSGTLNLDNCTVNGPLAVVSNGVLTVSGGSVLQEGLTLASGATVNWNNGSIEGLVAIASNAVLNINGTFYVRAGLVNAGTVNWNEGFVEVQLGNGIYNLQNAVFNVNVTSGNTVGYYYGSEFFYNAGLLQKSANGSAATIQLILTNSGTVEAQGGVLTFQNDTSYGPPLLGGVFLAETNAQIVFDGGGALTGVYTADTGATINLGGGPFSYGSEPVFTGAGASEITGGALTLASNVIPNLAINGGAITLGPLFQGGAITNLTLNNATLEGANTVTGILTMNGGSSELTAGALALAPFSTLNWSGGTLNTPVTVGTNAVMNFTGGNSTFLYSPLTNAGTLNWTGGSIYFESGAAAIYNEPGAVFNSEGGYQISPYYYYSSSSVGFVNAGLFLQTNSTGTTYIEVPFENAGSIDVASGTLEFYGNYGGNLGGNFQAGPGATILFESGGYLTGSYTALPGGTISLGGGVFSNSPAMAFTGGGVIQLNGGTVTLVSNLIPNLEYNGGTAILTPSFQGGTITNLTLNGTGISGDNVVIGTLTMNGGTISGSLTVAASAVMSLTGPNSIYVNGALTNAGTINWTGGNIYLETTNSLENLSGALFSIQCNQSFEAYDVYNYSTGTYEYAPFNNAGTITKTNSTGTTYFSAPLNNTGTVDVESGTLDLNSSSGLTGLYYTAPGTEFEFSGGSYSNAVVTPLFTGPGAYAMTGGNLYLAGGTIPNLLLNGGNVHLLPGFQGGTITNLTMNGATLAGTNTVTGVLTMNGDSGITGPLTVAPNAVFNYAGGYVSAPVVVSPGGMMNLTGPYGATFDDGLTNAGTINWTGGGIYLESTNALENLSGALFSIQCDQSFEAYAAYNYNTGTYEYAPINNAGTITKTNATGYNYFTAPINNTGTVDVESGGLEFDNYDEPGLTGGVWEVGITGAGSYGAFDFYYAAALTNVLVLNVENGFELAAGDTFVPITYGSETGSFSTASFSPPQGANYSLNYTPTNLTITVGSVVGPVVSIVSPANYQLFSAGNSIPLQVAVSDADTRVLTVQYYQGGTLIGTSAAGSAFPFTWPRVPAGFYTLTAVATDAAGATTASAPVEVLVTRPTDGSAFTWTGGSSANWSDPGNWSPARVPGALDNVNLNGGIVNLDSSLSVNSIVINGGVLGGAGSLAVNGSMAWTGGALNGAVTVAPGAALFIDGFSPLLLSNATLVNLGTANWVQGNLLADNGVITNGGTWLVTAGGSLTCGANFFNSGLLEATNGASVILNGGGTLDGTFIGANGAGIEFNAGNFYQGANPVFGGSGTVNFTGGVLTVTNTVGANLGLVGGTLALGQAFQNGGAISNLTLMGSSLSGSNVVTGRLNMTGGVLSGQMTVGMGGYLSFNGPELLEIESATLVNFGQIAWLGGYLFGPFNAITNNGQWLIECDDEPFDFSQTTFVNNGVVEKLATSGTSYLTFGAFVNNGTVDAQTGSIILTFPGALAGNYQAEEGAEIGFAGAGMTPGQSLTFSGSGSFDLTGGDLTLATNAPPGLNLSGGTVELGPNFQANGAITNLTLDGATLAGNYTVTGVLNVLGGGMSGSLVIASSATLNLMGPNEFDVASGALTNLGSVLWSGGGIAVQSGVLLVNQGLWVAQSDNDLGYYYYTTNSVFINDGTFLKQGTTGYTQIYGVVFDNAGVVDAESGIIDFAGGGLMAGTFNSASQATIDFSGGTFTLGTALSFTGSGTTQLDGSSLVLLHDQIPGLLLNSGTVLLGPAFQDNGAITNLTLNGASLSGTNVVTGTLNFLSGAINGALTVASSGTLVIGANNPDGSLYLESGVLTNLGTVLWMNGAIEGADNTLFVNNGFWLAVSDDTLEDYYYYYENQNYSGFLNNGVFRKAGTAGYTYIDMALTNNGLIDAESGTIYFESGGQIGGNYDTAAGAAITVGYGNFVNSTPAVFAGPGASGVQSPVITLLSDQISGLALTGGTVILGPSFQNMGAITNLTVSGATLQGSNVVTGTLNWTSGSLSTNLTVAPAGVLNISSTATKYLYYGGASSLVNYGTVVWSGGDLYGDSQTMISNNGLWLAQSDNTLYSYSQYTTFINNGTFKKAATAGTTTFSYVSFINSGALDVESGVVSFPSTSIYGQTVATLSFGASAPGLTGRLAVAGNVNLDGELTLNLLNGYAPVQGDMLTLITYPSAAGTFANFNLPPLTAGLNWEPQTGASSVTLRAAKAQAAANTLSLSGTVTDASHNPIASAVVYAAMTSATATNLIQNGSFELPDIGYTAYVYYSPGSTNIPGWTVTGSPGEKVDISSSSWNNEPAEDGNQYFDVTGSGGGGGITQTFPTTAGTAYDLIFYRGSYQHYGLNDALGVTIGGNSYAFGETSGGSGGLNWKQVVIPFTATSNFTTLSFTNLTGFNSDDAFLDNVQVVPPDYDRVIEAVTDGGGNFNILVANQTFQVGVSGLAALGYNDIASGPVAMNGTNQVINFVATPLSLSNSLPVVISTSANPPEAGTAAGGGVFTNGASVTVTAAVTNATVAYAFVSWTFNGVVESTNESYTFTARQSGLLVANFSRVYPPVLISAVASPAQAGETVGSGSYTNGATVNLFALATNRTSPFVFSSWTLGGVVQSSSASYSFTATESATLTANFLPVYSIAASNNPAGAGTVLGAGRYVSGAAATLTAGPAYGYAFGNWSTGGASISTNAVLTFTVSTNQTYSANYVATNVIHMVTVTASPVAAASTNLLGAGTYTNTQSAVIFAPAVVTNPPDIYLFTSFSLNGAGAGAANSLTKTFSTMDPPNLAYVANYMGRSIDPVLLNVSANIASPVPATTNYVLRLQFDRTMNTGVTPEIVLTNASAGASQPSVAAGGAWSTVASASDTYSTPPITIASNMDGTVQVIVSGAADTNGNILSQTNATNFVVRISPPVVAISAPANGFICTTTDTFNFSASASSGFGIASLSLYANGTNQVGTTASTNLAVSLGGLAAGSYRLTAVATDNRGLATTSAAANITVNIPGTYLIDFEAVDASTNTVSGGALAAYLAGYGVTLTNVTSDTAVGVQDEVNISDGALTVARSGENLLTQTGANGLVSYTLVFSNAYPTVSWWRTELLAGPGIATPAWQATAYDTNGSQVAVVREEQVFSLADLPAKQFTVSAPGIKSVTFTGDNSIGALENLPLDDLLLSTFSNSTLSVTLSANNMSGAAPGRLTLSTQASASTTEIDFYEGQTLISSSFGASATLPLQDLAPGTYNFTAVASDNNGSASSSTPVSFTVTPSPGVSVINFDSLDTSSGAVGGPALSNYLAGFGVTITNATLGTRLEADKGDDLARGALPAPSSPPNLFTQIGLSQPGPVTFTLALANQVQSFGFTRVGLMPGSSLALHPAWTAHALDAAGAELESVSEPLIAVNTAAIPARVFQLTGANIAAVRFDSDSQQAASFGAVLLDDLVLDTNVAPNNLSITLGQPGGSLSAPATIQLNATVSDANGLGAVDHVNFYLGPALIGVATASPYSATLSGVLPGTYTFTAQVVDTNGYAKVSAPVQATVTVGANSTLLNFDSTAAAANLSNYLAGFGITMSNSSPGTSVSVLSQASLYGAGYVSAGPPTNVLTQTGSNGPVSFTLYFARPLTQFSFTRPQLSANPYVVHPAWQVQAYDALGVPLAQAQQGLISSSTNVPAATFTLQSPDGIASIAFNSEGNGFGTFNAMLLDDFILTTNSLLPPAVDLTNPLPGQVYAAPGLIPVSASAVDFSGAITNVSFYANGGLIGSASASPYAITWTNSSTGSFAVTAVAADSLGLSRTSPAVNISVVPGAGVFGISQQPAGQTVALGGSVVFNVAASGSNLTYQWNLNGAPLPNGSSNVLTINPAADTDAGSYTVVVGSGGQSATSQVAVLTVLDPPGITVQPQSQLANIGDTVTLSVGASGTGPFNYQWTLNGTHISGATNSSFVISNAQPLNSGSYFVIVANAVAFTNSAVAAVAVVANGGYQSADYFSNRISINPLASPVTGSNSNATREAGEPLHDGKPGGKSIWYTWHASFTGVISLTTLGSSFDTLLAVYTGTNVADLTPVAADDDSGGYFTSLVTFNCVAGADYQIAVDGFQGASGTVTLGLPAGTGYRVLNPASGDAIPVITQQPTNQVAPEGSTVTLSVTASSVSPLTYQWYFQGAPVAGANTNQFVVSNLLASSVGNYSVLVANDVGSVTSANANVQVTVANNTGSSGSAQDKFGDAVDLSQAANMESIRRREDNGGDVRGFSVSQTFSTVGATKEESEPNAGGQSGGASEWYIYTTQEAGTLHLDTTGSAFNTILAAFTNSAPGQAPAFSNLVQVVGGFTTNYQTEGQPSLNVPNVPAGLTFYVVVDGYNGVSGKAQLNIGLGVPPVIGSQPQSQVAVSNEPVSFTVAATGTTNLYYQWQFDSANLAGATNTSYTVASAQAANAGTYTVLVSNVVGVVTSAPAVLSFQAAPLNAAPSILEQPENLIVAIGQRAVFSVTASGAAPLQYQWYFNHEKIAWATNATLALPSVASTGFDGAFYVVVSNSSGSATSSNATLTVEDEAAPKVTISAPANHSETTHSSIAVKGTATSKGGIDFVELLVNGNPVSVSGTKDWTATADLVPGTNRITATSVDTNGVSSAAVTHTVFRVAGSTLTLLTNGPGRILGAAGGATLLVGRGYTVTGVPAASSGFLFSNWMSGDSPSNLVLVSENPTLHFIMSSNLVLQASFGANPFSNVAGSYNGLFPTHYSEVTETNSGFISANLTAGRGAYSARMLLDGGAYPFSGSFDLTGDATNTIRRAGNTPVTVWLHLDLGSPFDNHLTGSVSNADWLSDIFAERAVFNARSDKATAYAGRYTMIIPPGTGAPETVPGGYGAATLANSLGGTAALAGHLGDGTAISRSAAISQDGDLPVYVPLYSGKGSLWGWLSVSNNATNLPPQTLSGAVSWIKTPVRGKSLYTNGFSVQTNVLASVYEPTNADILPSTNYTLTIAGAGQSSPLVYSNVWVINGKFTNSGAATNPTNKLAVSFSASTGRMSLTFRPTGGRADVAAEGVVLQGMATNGAGWFLGTNESGSFLLQRE